MRPMGSGSTRQMYDIAAQQFRGAGGMGFEAVGSRRYGAGSDSVLQRTPASNSPGDRSSPMYVTSGGGICEKRWRS
jgi:hypothetical protein